MSPVGDSLWLWCW